MRDTSYTRVSPSTFPQTSTVSASGPARADSSLVREAQRGDKAAFEELVLRYDRAVLRLAIHLTGSEQDGKDIYQEAFLRVYMNLPRFRLDCSFYTWIYRIVTNVCLDHLRKNHRRGQYVTTILTNDGNEKEVVNLMPDHAPSASPERTLGARELRRSILEALQRLSPRERMIFELRHYHGLKLRTVASILKTTEGTVKNTLFRATQKLRIRLAEVR